jgi:hypothetical protein
MKKLLFTCFLTLVLSNTNAQVNEYFKGNPQWGISEFHYFPFPCYTEYLYNYITIGDTLIDSLVYKKIKRKGYIINNELPNPNSQYNNCPKTVAVDNYSPTIYLRSSGKKMYIREQMQDELMYDFNLTVGDTLPVSYSNWSSKVVVTDIDIFYTSYGYRKSFSTSNGFKLLEGIGNEQGLLQFIGALLDANVRLNCYSLNDTAYYLFKGGSCNMNVSINSKIGNKEKASITPNPFVNEAILQFNNLQNNATFLVYNTMGQLVQSTIVISSTSKLERNNLPSGLYYYKLKQATSADVTGKFVVSD